MWRLDQACRLIRAAFDTPYLVGTAGEGGAYRDVDVRVLMDDEWFATVFGDNRDRWELLCVAIGDYLRVATGLPVDFQFQRLTEANERHGKKKRNPLGMNRVFAGGGDATPWDPSKSKGSL